MLLYTALVSSRVQVVGAAIVRDQRCLVAQRGVGMSLAGKWEFPGGKVEPGEAPERALRREIAEELGLRVVVGERLGTGSAHAGQRLILLEVFGASIASGTLVLREHAQVVWATADELSRFDWAEADVPCVAPVQAWLAQGGTPGRDWYECGANIVVFCGTLGSDGLYRISSAGDSGWEFCPVGTRLWDWYHQAAFNAHRAQPTTVDDHPRLPPLPSVWPPEASITVLDAKRRSVHEQVGSAVWVAVERAGGKLPVTIVLKEDGYETSFGDGCFRDFHTACIDEAMARTLAAQVSASGLLAHVRRGCLETEAGELRLTMADQDRTPFDHVTLADVCDALARPPGGEGRS